MTLSKTTRDHEQIRKWAESHGAVPAEAASTERRGEPGILRFEFPNAPNRNEGNLRKISWDNFFEKFDKNGLELVYQEKTADGQKSNFNKLVPPSNEERSSRRSQGGSHGSSESSHSPRSNKSEAESTSRTSESPSQKSASSASQSGGSRSHRSMADEIDADEEDIERSASPNRNKSSSKAR